MTLVTTCSGGVIMTLESVVVNIMSGGDMLLTPSVVL